MQPEPKKELFKLSRYDGGNAIPCASNSFVLCSNEYSFQRPVDPCRVVLTRMCVLCARTYLCMLLLRNCILLTSPHVILQQTALCLCNSFKTKPVHSSFLRPKLTRERSLC